MKVVALALLCLVTVSGCAPQREIGPPRVAAPVVFSPQRAVDDMLRIAKVGPNDVVMDLGSGDGRIVRTAARRYGARGIGIELNPAVLADAQRLAREDGVADKVQFVQDDLFAADVSRATVVTLYLLPEFVNELAPKLARELRRGTRVVSHDYPLRGWRPVDSMTYNLPEKRAISGVETTNIFLYVIGESI